MGVSDPQLAQARDRELEIPTFTAKTSCAGQAEDLLLASEEHQKALTGHAKVVTVNASHLRRATFRSQNLRWWGLRRLIFLEAKVQGWGRRKKVFCAGALCVGFIDAQEPSRPEAHTEARRLAEEALSAARARGDLEAFSRFGRLSAVSGMVFGFIGKAIFQLSFHVCRLLPSVAMGRLGDLTWVQSGTRLGGGASVLETFGLWRCFG